MRVVVAIGGNALLERGERPDAVIQRRHVREAAAALAPLAADHQLVLCHGNGPQVGMLALESQSDASLSRPYPLDVLVAQTQGMIGYWLVQELRNAGVAQQAACVLSQTVVDPADPAFGHPTKFIGASYGQGEAQALAARLGWTIAADGPRWRRVVASPRPTTWLTTLTPMWERRSLASVPAATRAAVSRADARSRTSRASSNPYFNMPGRSA